MALVFKAFPDRRHIVSAQESHKLYAISCAEISIHRNFINPTGGLSRLLCSEDIENKL